MSKREIEEAKRALRKSKDSPGTGGTKYHRSVLKALKKGKDIPSHDGEKPKKSRNKAKSMSDLV